MAATNCHRGRVRGRGAAGARARAEGKGAAAPAAGVTSEFGGLSGGRGEGEGVEGAMTWKDLQFSPTYIEPARLRDSSTRGTQHIQVFNMPSRPYQIRGKRERQNHCHYDIG